MDTHRIAIALGSNLGDRLGFICHAAERLSTELLDRSTLSSIYETPPWGFTEQATFLNAVIVGWTDVAPLDVLAFLHRLESELGRLPSFRYGPRVIDLDLVVYSDRIFDHPELKVPHSELAHRSFVLIPLAEVWPEWEHPMFGLTPNQMLASALGSIRRPNTSAFGAPRPSRESP